MMDTNSRHSHWFSACAFSTIALVSLLQETGKISDQSTEIKWSVSAMSIGVGLSSLAVVANMLLRDKFVSTPLEGGLATMTFGMWAAVLPTLMNPDNRIATVGAYGLIENANLYFFAWGAAVMSMLVFMGFSRDQVITQADTSNFQFRSWAVLTMTSLIVMMAASRQFDKLNCDDSAENKGLDVCDRTLFAILLGAFSGLVGLLWVGIGSWMRLNAMVDTAMALLMLIAWVFGVIFITFGGTAKAPAPVMSNLYFFTWGTFGLSVSLAASGVFNVLGMMMGGNEEEADAAIDEAEKKEDQEPDLEEGDPVSADDKEVAA